MAFGGFLLTYNQSDCVAWQKSTAVFAARKVTLQAIFCFEEWRCVCCLKPILQLKLNAAKILFSLLVVTQCIWLVFDELQEKKKSSPRFATAQNKLYILWSFYITKKTITEISNLGCLFIFSVLVFKTLLLIPNAILILHVELPVLKPALFVNAPLPLLPQS